MSDSQLIVTRREFQTSFKSHYLLYKNSTANDSSRSRRLLLFYSVECGLKSLIMKNTGYNTYDELKKNKPNVAGHDLKAMTKELGIESIYPLKRIRLAKSGGNVFPKRYNELWRYGVTIEDMQEEYREEQTLVKIADYILKR